MSFPALPPIGLDTMGEVHDVHMTDVPEPSAPRADALGALSHDDRAPIVGCALLGLAAGHRVMAPLAVLALAPPRRGVAVPALVALLAVGELVADKLPFVPARTRALPLFVRALSGAFAGGVAAQRSRRSVLGGAAVGGAAALAASGLGLQLRLAAEDSMPRVIAALVEDVLATSMAVAGSFLVRSRTDEETAERVRHEVSNDHETVRVRVSG